MQKTPLVLMVDDDADFREIVTSKLQATGFRTAEAKDGAEGFEMAKKLKPDLVLLDVKMPDVDGIEALHRLKQDPETNSLKVLFFTVLGEPEPETRAFIDQKIAREIGAVDYIHKSADLDQIVEKIKEVLGLVSQQAS